MKKLKDSGYRCTTTFGSISKAHPGVSITFVAYFWPTSAELFPEVLKNSPKSSASLVLLLTVIDFVYYTHLQLKILDLF